MHCVHGVQLLSCQCNKLEAIKVDMGLQLDYAHDFTTKIEKVLDREIKKTVSESN